METAMESAQSIPAQHQDTQPGIESKMQPLPVYDTGEKGCGKLRGKVAIITGGDSGIGRAVAVSFAKEGADVVIVYLNEHDDAKQTAEAVAKYNKKALLIAADLSEENNCKSVIDKTLAQFKHLDILVNNAGVQYLKEEFTDISGEQLLNTFKTNIFSQFYLVKYAVPYLKEGSTIINTTSITAYRGHETLVDYSSTKGAIVSFTRSLSQSLAEKGIRVNAVAPGPVWTPLIPSTFSAEEVSKFGKNTAYDRPAQPAEIAPCYVFLACGDSAFMTGQVLHPNGGSVVNA